MKLNFQISLTSKDEIEKKNEFVKKKNEFVKKKKKRKDKFAIHVNRPMNFLKPNNMFFFQNYFINYKIKIK
jgi:hypothetical protein